MRWWQIKKRNADLERELRSDIELEEEEQRENGLPPEEARYAARRAFGNAALIQDQTHEAWGWTPYERLLQDVRFAFRQILLNPGFAAIAVLTLALGIGANAAIFSLVDAIILRPSALPEPKELVGLGQWRNQKGEGYVQTGVSAANIAAIRRERESSRRSATTGGRGSTSRKAIGRRASMGSKPPSTFCRRLAFSRSWAAFLPPMRCSPATISPPSSVIVCGRRDTALIRRFSARRSTWTKGAITLSA